MSVVRYEAPADSTAKGKIEDPQGSSTSTEQSSRPEWLPEKFQKPEDLAKAYKELEQKQGGKPPAEAPKVQEPEKKPAATEPPKDAPEPENNDLFKPFFEEFTKDGKLSEESYKKLAEEHKLPKATVDEFIALRQAKAASETQRIEQETQQVFESVGGQEAYLEMAEWARENLKPEEVEAFNSTLETGNFAQIKLAVAGLHQKFASETGKGATRIRGNASSSGVTPFQNTKEVTDAMSDPRYATDDAYRAEVARRLAASKVF